MGLRDDAARWAQENDRMVSAAVAAAAAGAELLPLPDWHAELVSELRLQRLPQLPVHTYKARRRPNPSKPSRNFKFTRTGETVWIIEYRRPDHGSRAGWSAWEYLGITDAALGGINWFAGQVVEFKPFTHNDRDKPATWRPRIVPLFAALLGSQTSAVDGATGAEIRVRH